MDVGSGTGYLTTAMALIMPPGSKVFGIEHVPELVKKSKENVAMKSHTYRIVEVKGWKSGIDFVCYKVELLICR